MTRKDYILLAEVLRVERNVANLAARAMVTPNTAQAQVATIDAIALSLCDSLKRDNSRFNSEHFIAVVRGDKELLSRPKRAA